MRYKYASYLNDLKDLKHIEWFVLHNGEYEFVSLESQRLLENLKNNIQNKNIYYSEILNDFEKLVEQFDNNPYNYIYDTEGKDVEKSVESSYYENYFTKVRDSKERRVYTVPYGYVIENPGDSEVETKAATTIFSNTMAGYKRRAFENLEAVLNHYFAYWNSGGVKDAMDRFESVGYGKGYRLPKTMVLYFVYNVILFLILAETRYFGMLTHIWQILSEDSWALYSAMNIFSGYKYIGAILFLAITYFVILDIHYSYGIYYMIFIKSKYKDIEKYHGKVASLYEAFNEDYVLCKQGIIANLLVKRNHRDSVYVPFVLLANRRYNFWVERKVTEEDENGKKIKTKKKVVESIIVPDKCFINQPIRKRLLWILIMLVIVQAFCNYSMILFY